MTILEQENSESLFVSESIRERIDETTFHDKALGSRQEHLATVFSEVVYLTEALTDPISCGLVGWGTNSVQIEAPPQLLHHFYGSSIATATVELFSITRNVVTTTAKKEEGRWLVTINLQ